MPPMSGMAEPEKMLPDPRLTPPAASPAAEAAHADPGVEPSQVG
jgi:hypothetical protein